MLKVKLDHPLLDDDERTRINAQIEAYEKQLSDNLRTESDQQSSRLKRALEESRGKRKDLFNQISEDRQNKVLDNFRSRANNKVNIALNEGAARDLSLRLQNGFEKHEFMQVTENYLDMKNEKEYIDLSNALFEERTRALRGYIFELMTQKQTEYRLLQEEYEPQREFLRNKKQCGLITEEQFNTLIDRLNDEQTERESDVDLEFSEKENILKEELEKCRIDAEVEQKKLLKDRQTQEKLIMFKQLMQKVDSNDALKQYLESQMKEANKDMDKFAKQQDKEKERKIIELNAQKDLKMQELIGRQDRMFNWEEKMLGDEKRYKSQFQRQNEEVLAKKMAEQQKELLRDMSQKDVDSMLARHKRELETMDDALKAEQNRQMEKMRIIMK